MSPYLRAEFILILNAVHERTRRITNSRLKDFSPLEYRKMGSFKSICKAGFDIFSGNVSLGICVVNTSLYIVCVVWCISDFIKDGFCQNSDHSR